MEGTDDTTTLTCKNGCCMLKQWPYEGENILSGNKKKAGVAVRTPDDKVLLIRSRGNMWGFPKGGRHHDESALDGAIRELKEETGIELDKRVLTYSYRLNGVTFFSTVIDECPIKIDQIRSMGGNDSSGIGWVKLACLGNMIGSGLPITSHIKKHLLIK